MYFLLQALPHMVFENCECKTAGKIKMSLGSPLYKVETGENFSQPQFSG